MTHAQPSPSGQDDITTYTLDGSTITSPDTFYDEFSRSLELNSYFGQNLDAMWDVLTGCIDTPYRIRWVNFHHSSAVLDPAFRDMVVEIFHRAESYLTPPNGEQSIHFETK